MHRFFFWIPYSLRNYLKKIENFYQLDLLVGNRLSRFDGFQLKFIIGSCSNSEHLKICALFFLLDSFFFKKYYVKISDFFSTGWNWFSKIIVLALMEH